MRWRWTSARPTPTLGGKTSPTPTLTLTLTLALALTLTLILTLALALILTLTLTLTRWEDHPAFQASGQAPIPAWMEPATRARMSWLGPTLTHTRTLTLGSNPRF